MMTLTDNRGNLHTESELNKLTKADLLALAGRLGVEGVTSSMLKSDIVASIMGEGGA